jgi:hypothetical protein
VTEQAEQIKNFMVEGTNNKLKKCKKENWQLLVRIGLRQDDRLMED